MSNGNNNIKIFDGLVSKTKAYLVIIAILLIILCFYEYKLILPSIFIYFLILIYTYWTNKKRKAELSEHIKELTINVDKVSKRTLINSPFPLIIVETDGNVIWKSTKFVEEFANVDINNYLTSIIKEIKLEIENSDKKDKKNIINNYELLLNNCDSSNYDMILSSMLKEIGSRARVDRENRFGQQVYLELYVKCIPNWRDKEFILKDLGFYEF